MHCMETRTNHLDDEISQFKSHPVFATMVSDDQKRLRKVVSDVSSEYDRFRSLEAIREDEEVIVQAECECCGLKEDCTQNYLENVKGYYSGNWMCGLCCEAVKDRLMEDCSAKTMQDAVRSHREFCEKFNTTTRMNPKLSLTMAMKDIAKRSCEKRRTTNAKNMSNLARSSSCVPKIN